MTYIINMASGTECEGDALYSKPRQLNTAEDGYNELRIECTRVQLALVETEMSEPQASIVPPGLDIGNLLDSAD